MGTLGILIRVVTVGKATRRERDGGAWSVEIVYEGTDDAEGFDVRDLPGTERVVEPWFERVVCGPVHLAVEAEARET